MSDHRSWKRRLRRLVTQRLNPWVHLRRQLIRAGPYLADRRARSRCVVLEEGEIKEARRSDRVFVFGSGFSLNEISSGEWAAIGAHDTLGFNYFPHQRFVRTDFHLVGELITGDDLRRSQWEPALRAYATLLTENPLYRDTIIGLQEGWTAFQSNRIVGLGLLRPDTRVFRYRRVARGVYRLPTRSLGQGLVLGAASLVACVNLAYILGWREIVLTGVDLYDGRYFWMPRDVPRPDLASYFRQFELSLDMAFPMARPVVNYLGRWTRHMEAEGVRLSVYNPRSLLAEVMPVHAIESVPVTTSGVAPAKQ